LNDSVQNAIDRIAAHDWTGAKQALQSLQERDDERTKAATEIRHEIANAVSIVQANLEGILDGVLEPTPGRLETLHEALTGITGMLDRWRQLRG
jgi:hypothetical protein